jgi:hypothetical protein
MKASAADGVAVDGSSERRCVDALAPKHALAHGPASSIALSAAPETTKHQQSLGPEHLGKLG